MLLWILLNAYTATHVFILDKFHGYVKFSDIERKRLELMQKANTRSKKENNEKEFHHRKEG